jgi:hypothetical protein
MVFALNTKKYDISQLTVRRRRVLINKNDEAFVAKSWRNAKRAAARRIQKKSKYIPKNKVLKYADQ